MIELQDYRSEVFWAPQALATNASASARIDLGTFNAHYVVVEIEAPPATAGGSVKLQALTIGAANTTTFSTSNIISGLSGTTNSTAETSEFVLSNCNDTAKNITRIGFDPSARGRYIFVQLQPPAGTFNTISVRALIGRMAQSPDSATEAGVTNAVYI